MADTYRVTSQRQTTDFGPDGRFVDVMEVRFVTNSGTSGVVRIPLDRYSADYVHAQIADYVTHIEAVNNL